MVTDDFNTYIAEKIMHCDARFVRNYTTDANDDLLVMHKVRSSWRGEKLQMFIGALFQIYATRTKDPQMLFLQYQTGDYSAAALQVIRSTP
jgi:hypothetical protein